MSTHLPGQAQALRRDLAAPVGATLHSPLARPHRPSRDFSILHVHSANALGLRRQGMSDWADQGADYEFTQEFTHFSMSKSDSAVTGRDLSVISAVFRMNDDHI